MFHSQSRVMTVALNSGGVSFWPISPRMLVVISVSLIILAILSVAAYVAAVNSILLNGEAMKSFGADLKAAAKKYAELQEVAIVQQSPAWLEEHSREVGMIEVGRVRFLNQDWSVARR